MNFLETQAPRLLPELTLFVGALLCLLTGLSPKAEIRRLTATLAVFSAVLATMMVAMPLPEKAQWTSPVGLHNLPAFLKGLVGILGVLLLMVGAKVPDRLRQVLGAESATTFDAGSDYRGEFFAFTLVSMAGAMLCAGAGDLVWLLLALELVSLPSYVMIACSRDDGRAQESAIKYFFLGAMAAAVFLFGFALMYGATGHTDLAAIRAFVQAHGASHLMMTGVVLAVAGIAFKIAAAPMHAYTQDVYEGAATPVTAFLAVIPKIAGFAALILVLGTVGWFPGKNAGPHGVSPLPDVLIALLSLMAVVSMVVGNTLGVLAKGPKRMMGCSSIAQSGYLLLALLAGPTLLSSVTESLPADASFGDRFTALFAGGTGAFDQANGIGALLFYLAAYAMGTIAVLAAMGCLVDKHGHDANTWHDFSGLRHRHPMLAFIIALGALSLMGLPVLGGFIGKMVVANATLSSGASKLAVVLVVLLVANSAVSAAYYMRLAYTVLLGADNNPLIELPVPTRRMAALVAVVAALAMGGLLAQPLLKVVNKAAGMPAPEAPVSSSVEAR